jgi:AcrR family transcriptional regulator
LPEPSKPRNPLSRERILAGAIDLADAEGLSAISMRRLAASLNVEAMSLYYYVRSKNDLLGAILERVLGDVEVPLPGASWKGALRSISLSAHAVLDRHRWAAQVLMTPSASSQARSRWTESVLASLAAAGLPPGLADHAYHALDSYVIGFTLWESSIPFSGAELEDVAREYLASMPVDELPHTAAHIRWHLERPGGEGPRAFESGLDMLLDGLELARGHSAPTGP